jgi:hypothetical protein
MVGLGVNKMDDLFGEHLNAVLKLWPDVLDINAIGLAGGDYDLKLRRSIALNHFYDDEIEPKVRRFDTTIPSQLSWIVHSMISAAMKKGQVLIRPHDLDRDELKRRLDELLLKHALPQMNGTKEPDGSFDFAEVKGYLMQEGLIDENLRITDQAKKVCK